MDDPSRAKQRAATPRLRLLESDPLQKIDFRKDANATAVEDMLNLTKEERRELETTARIDTPTDIAAEACREDSHKLGCKAKMSPIHCLAMAVKEKAVDISPNCRKKAEKSLQYACSVELYNTHCDGVTMPLAQCLDKHHPSLGEECKDTLIVTKKVANSLKGLKTSDKEDLGALGGDSRGVQTIVLGLVPILIVLAVLWIRFERADLFKTLQDLALREVAAARIPGFRNPLRPHSKFDEIEFGMEDEEPLLRQGEVEEETL